MEDEDDWRQCAEWLNRCQVLPDDHPALRPDGNALHLVHALMDGVALCRTLEALSNNQVNVRAMKDFSINPQSSQFLCCQNIRLFTQLCEKEFDVPRSFLIQPNDIYQARNFGKAIALLSKLSHSPRAQASSITGFPPENSELQTTHEYYNNLEEFAASLENLPDQTLTNYALMEEESKEKLYDTVVHQGPRSAPTAPTEPITARSSCIREIIDTEKNYVDLLKMLLEKYKVPLTGVLSPEELEEILKFIDELYSIHRELLNNLNLATSQKMNFISLSDVFLQIRDRLLIYGEYCGHVQRAQSLVLELMRNDVDKRTKIESCQTQSEKFSKFHLTELLTVPIQRVLKDHLLLEQLCKLTPADHPDRAELLQAHEAMKELAQSINEVKRDLDTISAIDQIQASLLKIQLPPDKKLSTYGRRHMDGEVKVLYHKQMKSKIRYLFLFDKTMLVCKPKGDSFTFMMAYHIMNTPFQEVQSPVKKGEKYSYGFTLPIADSKPVTDLTFFAKSPDIRQTWLHAAQAAISNLFPPGARDNGYHFEMHTFQKPTYCYVCNKLLQGIFYQGYRCRETGIAAHKSCLALNALPPRGTFTTSAAPVAHMNGFPSHTSPSVLIPSPHWAPYRNRPQHANNTGGGPWSASCALGRSASSSGALLAHDLAHFSDSISLVNHCLASDAHSLGHTPHRRISSALVGHGSTHGEPSLVSAVVRKFYSCEANPPVLESNMTVAPGDVVDIMYLSEDGAWCRGRCRGAEAWFPIHVLEPVSHRSLRSTIDLSGSGRFAQHFTSSPPSPSMRTVTASVSTGRSSNPTLPHGGHRHSLSSTMEPGSDSAASTRLELMRPETWATFDADSAALKSSDAVDSLSSHEWYVGQMDRAEAVALLAGAENGTFLVRVSKSAERSGEYSLTLVYGHPCHIQIHRSVTPDGQSIAYGLCELEQFPSISALIDHYSKVSLNRCFDEVDTRLLHPYQRCPNPVLFFVRANFDFSDPSNARLLPLKREDRIAVVSTVAEDRGWWKGWLHGRIGFFPKSYVERETSTLTMPNH